MTKAQKNKAMKELAELIVVRNHVSMLVNTSAMATKTDRRTLMNFVSSVDKDVIDSVLQIVLPKVVTEPTSKDMEMAAAREQMKQEGKTQPEIQEVVLKPKRPTRKGMVNRVLD